MKVVLTCPAKINTFLSVGPPDDRGWHPLRTIFQAIDLVDELTIEPSETDCFSSDADWLPLDNSATKAIHMLRELVEVPPLRVHLAKRIPAQAGLGGGSSDAAAILRGVNMLLEKPLGADTLHRLALSIGADVPFFLVGGRAKAEGYGERLTALDDVQERFLVVAKPDVDCSTVEMYRRLDAVSRLWLDFPDDDLLHNDFELVAPAECHQAIRLLKAFQAVDAGLTGSGSAVFGRFEEYTTAATATELMRGEGFDQVWCIRTLSRDESLQTRRTT